MYHPRFEAPTLPQGDAPMREDHAIEAFALHFTGSGSEYFRVWIVNLLLTVITLGLYAPFARRRTVRYFYGHTEVAHTPLEFTGRFRSMVLGFLLLATLYFGYTSLGDAGYHRTSRVLATIAVLLSPWLWAGALRFRLASTRWRGVSLRFWSTWAEVYVASWPLLALLVLGLALDALLRLLAPAGLPAVLALMLGSLAISLPCIARLDFNRRRLLVRNAWIGDQPGRWKPAFAPFLHVWLGACGRLLAGLATMAGVIGFLGWMGLAVFPGGQSDLASKAGLVAALVLTTLVGTALVLAPVWAWLEARLFQLTWSGTGVGAIARLRCELSVGRYVRLSLVNMLLMQLTLGLYLPFARVAAYRLKVESVTLHVKGSLCQLAGRLAEAGGGLGDAAADAVGLDLVG